jgi:hypothetical protein
MANGTSKSCQTDGRIGQIIENEESTFALIDKITARVSKEPLDTEAAQLRWLQFWWCKHYNRPFKDPLLLSYTLEELYYEFRLYIEKDKANEERSAENNDKIEQAKVDDALSWAEQEEAKEQAADGKQPEPGKSPEDVAWMEEQMRLARQEHGDDFGEDISEVFDD